MEAKIRKITVDDAACFLDMLLALDKQAKYMMLEPGERSTSIEHQRQRISRILEKGNSCVFVVEVNERLVGFLSVEAGAYRRNRHCGYIVIGILQEFTGKGIGTRLFEETICWAKGVGLHKLELTVVTRNMPAIRLYEKVGFVCEGTKKDSLYLSGEYVDEFYMGLVLGD